MSYELSSCERQALRLTAPAGRRPASGRAENRNLDASLNLCHGERAVPGATAATRQGPRSGDRVAIRGAG
jgi:hypothetical protein